VAAREAELAMVKRHVRDGKRCVTRQREIVAHLEKNGHPTESARALLTSFEEVQVLHKQHLARLMSEVALGV